MACWNSHYLFSSKTIGYNNKFQFLFSKEIRILSLRQVNTQGNFKYRLKTPHIDSKNNVISPVRTWPFIDWITEPTEFSLGKVLLLREEKQVPVIVIRVQQQIVLLHQTDVAGFVNFADWSGGFGFVLFAQVYCAELALTQPNPQTMAQVGTHLSLEAPASRSLVVSPSEKVKLNNFLGIKANSNRESNPFLIN